MNQSESNDIVGPHHYRNAEAMLAHGERVWLRAADSGLLNIQVDHESNDRLKVFTTDGQPFAAPGTSSPCCAPARTWA